MSSILHLSPLYYELVGAVLLLVIILAIVVVAKVRAARRRRAEALRPPAPVPPVVEKVPPLAPPAPPSPPAAPKRDIRSLLAKTRDAFTSQLDALILKTKQFDTDFVDSLEELLYTSDLGPKTVEKLLTAVREKLSRGELSSFETVKQALYEEILIILKTADGHTRVYGNGHGQPSQGQAQPQVQGQVSSPAAKPWVILVVGVNGVGKTTSIGKLAHYYTNQNKKVLVVAGDTFRAAAEHQLSIWGERAHVEVYTSEQTKDPAAVAYQGIQKGVAEGADVIIVDTAGRLHTKENLMDELKKVKRVAGKAFEGAPHEIILVIDANSGQNAKVQARQFNEALQLTSLIVTKLDGTARGGVIVGIAEEIGVGVQFIGTGEGLDDLQKFSTDEYAKGLLQLA